MNSADNRKRSPTGNSKDVSNLPDRSIAPANSPSPIQISNPIQGSNAIGNAESRNLLRQNAKLARSQTTNREERSQRILARLQSLPAYSAATDILFYVNTRDEVITVPAIADALRQCKRVCVPYCVGEDLYLFEVKDLDDLTRGAFGILEPRLELREVATRQRSITEMSIVVVPGIAFDAQGGRLGYGKGYYDRLLANAHPNTCLIGLAFDSQIFEQIPMESHDVPMHVVLTETSTFNVIRS